MARTACSEACLAIFLHEKSFSASRALTAHVAAPLSSGRAARSSRKSQLVIFCSGRLLGCLEIQYGHQHLGMERTTTSSLVTFQPFQPGRNTSRHALRVCFAHAHVPWYRCVQGFLCVSVRDHRGVLGGLCFVFLLRVC